VAGNDESTAYSTAKAGDHLSGEFLLEDEGLIGPWITFFPRSTIVDAELPRCIGK
jgi:hypothetical protein